MAMVGLHSIPAQPQPAPCESAAWPPPAALAPYVVGWSAFRAGGGAAVRHRLLPVNVTVLVVDVTGADRLVTGARAGYGIHATERWREGVTVGLTPAGTAALLGAPAREFAGATVQLADVLGRRREAELAERLAAEREMAARLAVVAERVGAWLAAALGGRGAAVATPAAAAGVAPDGVVARAWRRLQRPGPRIAVPVLAERLGVSRRYLELRFQREIGLSPGRVARIARLQHAVGRLAATLPYGPTDPPPYGPADPVRSGPAYAPGHPAPYDLARTAAVCGYADQPHFTRDVRELTGLTPAALCANLQYAAPARR
ncbi:AraC family transcriptional regulator [Streptomyces sp. MAR4 CNX-425]|uniref:helix-turn-helix transcriptional regulator n=1 Tax=Streptomyces sp. MAR4 CNX-425 TaxID=3406343 RepID=UPI003B50FA97